MSFIAKYRGPCYECDDDIIPGQEAEFNSGNFLIHVVCPDDRDFDGKPKPVCPQCFMVLPKTGLCDCRE